MSLESNFSQIEVQPIVFQSQLKNLFLYDNDLIFMFGNKNIWVANKQN